MLLLVLGQICLICSANCRCTSIITSSSLISWACPTVWPSMCTTFLTFLLGSWHDQYLIFRWITREEVGFIPATSCIPALLKTADDVVNLLTRNIYLVVFRVSTQLRSNVFIKQIILIKIPRHWAKWWPLWASTSSLWTGLWSSGELGRGKSEKACRQTFGTAVPLHPQLISR